MAFPFPFLEGYLQLGDEIHYLLIIIGDILRMQDMPFSGVDIFGSL